MKNLLFTLAGIACLALAGCNDNNDAPKNKIAPTASRLKNAY